ncbi:MAG TPA: peptidylprolyl isomerase [Polyangia bacterium]
MPSKTEALRPLPPPPKGLLAPNKLPKKAPKKYKVEFKTTRGTFVLDVTRARAPYSADRFFGLVKSRYFDGVRFFDITPGQQIDFGVHGHPAVNRVWANARMLDDIPHWSNRRGLVSFSSVGPMTRTTRLTIHMADNQRLDDKGYVPFAYVSSGMQVLANLYSGYGPSRLEGKGPRLDRVMSEGNPYLAKEFPKLDYIKSAAVIR